MALSNFEEYQRDLYIKSNAINGISVNETQRGLTALGWGMRRQTLQGVYRDYAGIPKKADAMKYTPKNSFIDPSNYVDGKGYMKMNYSYVIEYQTLNPATGELFTRYTSIVSDTPIRYGAVMDEAELIGSTVGYWQQEEVQSVKLQEARQKAGAQW